MCKKKSASRERSGIIKDRRMTIEERLQREDRILAIISLTVSVLAAIMTALRLLAL